MTHSPSCPLSISNTSSPPPPCPHPFWLLHRPCCCAATSSRSLDMPPPPLDALPPVVYFSSRLPLICWLVVMLHLIALPPPCITFHCTAASCVHPLPPAFICTGWLSHHISSLCLHLPSSCQHHRLSTRRRLTLRRQLQLPFAFCSPGLVAVLPHAAPLPHIC
jgi:hypothetical protein